MNRKYVVLATILLSFVCATIKVKAEEPATTEAPSPLLELKHEKRVDAIAIAPDGKKLASATTDWKEDKATSIVHLWSLEDGKLQKSWEAGAGSIKTMAFSRDGKMLAIGSIGAIILWSSEGARQKSLNGHTESVESLAFSPDGKSLASGGLKRLEDKSVSELFLWDLVTGTKRELPVEVPERTSFVGVAPALVFSSDGTQLAAPQSHFIVGVWDVASLQLKNSIGDETVRGVIRAVAFSRDNKKLATGHMGHELRLWDIQNGRLEATLLKIKENWDGTGPPGEVIGITFRPDEKTMISVGTNQEGAGGEAELLVWNWPERQISKSLIKPPSNGIKKFVWADDASIFATVESLSSTIKVWRSTP